MEIIKLSDNDKERLMQSMLDFVLRGLNSDSSPDEVSILPEIITLLLQYFAIPCNLLQDWAAIVQSHDFHQARLQKPSGISL